jgi:opacity protein-like surface antigen
MKTVNRRLVFCGIALLSFFPLTSLASLSNVQEQQFVPYVEISAGVLQGDIGKTANVVMDQDIPEGNTYYLSNTTINKLEGGIGFGLLIPLHDYFNVQVGVSAYQTEAMQIGSGAIYDFGNPNYHNSDFQYRFYNTRVMLETRLLFQATPIIFPYLSGGIGYSRNHAYNYSSCSTGEDYNYFKKAPFADHTTAHLGYHVGAGVDFVVADGLIAGIEYQYADLGDATLGNSPDQVGVASRLSLGHIRTHNVLVHVTYLLTSIFK